jgi:outer membrane immunogenic protein
MMQISVGIAAVALLIGTPALAADMAIKAPPATVVAPPLSWTGPYAGISGGYGWGHSDQWDPGFCVTDCVFGTFDGSYKINGGLLGGTVGQNWQWGASVIGLESDWSWADIGGSSGTCGLKSGFPHPCGTKLDFLGTLRGRVGVPIGPNGAWLPYVTGGYAYGQVKAWDNFFPANGSDYRSGWTVGGGIETLFAPNWSFKVEYLYVDFGNKVMFNVAPGVPEWVSVRTNVVRVGINYQSR